MLAVRYAANRPAASDSSASVTDSRCRSVWDAKRSRNHRVPGSVVARACADWYRLLESQRGTMASVKIGVQTSALQRLATVEQLLLQIEEMTAGLRQYLDRVAEMARIVADELGESRMTTHRVVIVNNAARLPPSNIPRPRGTGQN